MTCQEVHNSLIIYENKEIEIYLKPRKPYTKIGSKIKKTDFENNIYSLVELLDSHKVFYKYRNWKIGEFAVYYTIPVDEWFNLTKLSSNYLVSKQHNLRFGKINYINKDKLINNKCIEIYASYNF